MAVLIAVGAFLTTLLGGLVAHRIGDRRHLVLGLAAGLMLGVVGFDLLPEALQAQHRPVFGVPAALLTFVAGFLVIHVVERSVAVHRAHEGEYALHVHHHGPGAGPGDGGPSPPDGAQPPRGVGLAAAAALIGHSTLDGFAIGAAFQAGRSVGVVVAVAVVAHDFADGFNTYTITRLYGNARRRALALLGCDALAPVAGAAITLGFTIPAPVLGLYLGFFGGFLLYLATSDILPEAHSPHPSLSTLLCTVAGCGFMWLVIGLAQG
ncbi:MULTISPECIES: ZIP family metal transporter [Streptomycetaceae]|uniref:Zinc/iron permease n=1 Tax=Streptantibioticus cattleyicolor (strain ATCC 35852 / DSM 46488 / JCM 4925 / NBRC 14057 / NRRL 8057) TaxID=1003195 RepID=F8JYI4_STREN|nr:MULTISPECIES: ZIP family metal transporter [Streptomycetaceae]AEW97202.1 zinc/iron permease [Streptantibioticus cattleyicolor NRRL 8057 = DSM 46488]MYS61657.1 ZIP family metal transporter [Streptomyces sp. SID5468]CCB77524.1 putative permease [Streptantibioticus cattleyicolor NRRL 8057 = DSM 46488]